MTTAGGNGPVFIYALADPFSGQIRYIGKSIRPRERLTNHCNERSVTWRTKWIRQVLQQGARPQLRILEELPPEADWQVAEREWISYGRAQCWPLTNCTSGGDGVPNLAPESREKVRRTWIGRKHSPETIAKIGAASRGRKHTAEFCARQRARYRGRKFTTEWTLKIKQAVSKLTDDQVIEIRRQLANEIAQHVIAARFGVHQGTISNIKRGKTYTHVPPDPDFVTLAEEAAIPAEKALSLW